jgi:hypothetical protein
MFTGHTLGQANNVGTGAGGTDIPFSDCYGGFYLLTKDSSAKVDNLSELFGLFITGPDSTGKSLPENLVQYKADVTRGTFDISTSSTPANSFPAVPIPCLAGELFDCLAPDTTDTEVRGTDMPDCRYYGRLNINTAPKTVLAALPWPRAGQTLSIAGKSYMFTNTDTDTDGIRDDVEEIVDQIIADRSTKPFQTPGELALTLGNWTDNKLALTADDLRAKDYLLQRNALYGRVSNLISTQSDVYAVYIRLQVGDGDDPDVEEKWHYLAVIDRSNCWKTGDEPALLLFTPLK